MAQAGSMIFAHGVAQLAGLNFRLEASRVRAAPAAVALTGTPGHGLRLPQDALAVLGGPWSAPAGVSGWMGR